MPGRLLEHLPNSLSGLGTALDVTLSTNLLRDSKTIGPGYHSLVHPLQILHRLGVFSEILLARNENDGEAVTEVKDFRDPLGIVSVSQTVDGNGS
jgi:hypothetical protein